jgi:hypothetical protein
MSGSAAAADPRDMSLGDLFKDWGSAIIDPATYTTFGYLGGFFSFLKTETFLSVFSGSSGTLSNDTFLGSVPNLFFIVCVLCCLLSVAIAVVEIKKAERQKRVVK